MTSSMTVSEGDSGSVQFSFLLRQRREELGLKGAEVARRAGIDPKRYSNYETGKREPDLVTLKKISAALHTTSDELLSQEPLLLSRDEHSYQAVQRFQVACTELTGEDVEMLADVAEVARRRRRDEREQQAGLAERDPFVAKLGAARSDLAMAYERLMPAIVRTHRPNRVQTEAQERADGVLHLWIIVHYPKQTDAKGAAQSLLKMAKERLGIPDSALRLVLTQINQGELEVQFEILCGARGG